jgi:flagellar biosynthesis protein FliR
MSAPPAIESLQLLSVLLTFVRTASILLTAPIFGSRHVPLKTRLLLAGFVSIAVSPLVPVSPAESQLFSQSITISQLTAIMPVVFSEIVVGIMLGLGVLILVATAKTAGMVMGQLAGMQWTTDADTESAEPISAISQLFGILSIAVFVLIGGPELLVSALIESYHRLPRGTSFAVDRIPFLLAELLQQSFLLTLRGVAPAVAALLISTITIGMLSRAYPFMNMLGVGFNSNQFIFLLAVCLTMGGSVWFFVGDVDGWLQMVQQRLGALHE